MSPCIRLNTIFTFFGANDNGRKQQAMELRAVSESLGLSTHIALLLLPSGSGEQKATPFYNGLFAANKRIKASLKSCVLDNTGDSANIRVLILQKKLILAKIRYCHLSPTYDQKCNILIEPDLNRRAAFLNYHIIQPIRNHDFFRSLEIGS